MDTLGLKTGNNLALALTRNDARKKTRWLGLLARDR